MANTPNSFPNLEDILNQSRAIVNDAYNAGGGEILQDTAPFTLPYINSSLLEIQDKLGNNAEMSLMVDNFIVIGLEVVAVDPSLQTFIDVNGYHSLNSTGVAVLLDGALVLPTDLLSPEFLWERPSGSNLPFVQMSSPKEGLVSALQGPALNQWEWRQNAIWFRGATTLRDIRIRYRRLEANIAPGTDYTTIYVDFPGAANALAYLIAFRYVMSRNPDTSVLVRAEADRHLTNMLKRIVRAKQGIDYRRPAYNQMPMRNRNTYGR